MTILLDIDGVVANPFEEVNFLLQRDGWTGLIHPSRWTSQSLEEIYSHIPAEIIGEKFDSELAAKNAIPYEDSWYWINHMSNEHHIVYITARNPELESITYNWFYDWNIPVDHIYFSTDKVKVINELDDHICFVEDRVPAAVAAAEAGHRAYLITREYNKAYDCSPAIRIDSLWEVEDAG